MRMMTYEYIIIVSLEFLLSIMHRIIVIFHFFRVLAMYLHTRGLEKQSYT